MKCDSCDYRKKHFYVSAVRAFLTKLKQTWGLN